MKTGYFTSPGVKATVANAMGSSSLTAAPISTYLIDVASNHNNPTDLSESFRNETKRLAADCVNTYNNEEKIYNLSSLMTCMGKLIYPSATMYDDPTAYAQNIQRFYYRKFKTNDSTAYYGGIIRFESTVITTETAFVNNLTAAEISIDGGQTWYNLRADAGSNDVTGIKKSFKNKTVTFAMPTGVYIVGSSGFILKLGWNASPVVSITNITVTLSNNITE